MRARHLVPPQPHCFGDQRRSRCFQPEKYNLRALASGWEQRAVLPWRCLASFNSSISTSLVTSTLRHIQRPVSSSPHDSHTQSAGRNPSGRAGPIPSTLLAVTDTHTHTLPCDTSANHADASSTPRRHRGPVGGQMSARPLRRPPEEPAGVHVLSGVPDARPSLRLLYKPPFVSHLPPVNRGRGGRKGGRNGGGPGADPRLCLLERRGVRPKPCRDLIQEPLSHGRPVSAPPLDAEWRTGPTGAGRYEGPGMLTGRRLEPRNI